MSYARKIEKLIQAGQDIQRTRAPSDRQRKWREWSESARNTCDSLITKWKPTLSLTYEEFSIDIESLKKWQKDEIDEETTAGPPTEERSPTESERLASHTDEIEESSDAQNRIDVFLSYLSKDEEIARTVKDELISLNERIHVFAAYDDVRSGEPWKPKLIKQLNKSMFFILIYTDPKEDWQWPICEATIFDTNHTRRNGVDSPLCCLHDTKERPRPFEEYQCNLVELFSPEKGDDNETQQLKKKNFYEEKSDIYKFLKDFLEHTVFSGRKFEIERYRKKLTESAHRIAGAFVKNRKDDVVDQDYYPPRIEISLWPNNFENHDELLDNAIVNLKTGAGSIFKLSTKKSKDLEWKSFVDHLNAQSEELGLLWVEQLRKAIVFASDGGRPDPVFATFSSNHDNRFYRPLLTRQEYYGSGMRQFYVTLVEQPPEDFTAHQDQGTLLASLILGSRFRFEFIDRRLIDLAKDHSEDEFMNLCANMERQIYAIENEAARHSLLDKETLVNCFPPSNRENIAGLHRKWTDIRKDILSLTEKGANGIYDQETARNGLVKVLGEELRPMNSEFMKIGAERYLEMVNKAFNN